MTDETQPFAFSAPLTVCVDVKHPLTYLAVAPVRALAAELGIEVAWLPFTAAGLKPPPAADPARGNDRGTRHRRLRADYQASEIARYAEAQGIVIRDPFRAVDSSVALLGLLWLHRQAPQRSAEFLEQVCRGHWAEDLDITDSERLGAILENLGQDAPAFREFAATRGPAELAEQRRRLVAAGVFAVPSLVVEGEVFVGRAHLPMVRWLLGGRAGPAPV